MQGASESKGIIIFVVTQVTQLSFDPISAIDL